MAGGSADATEMAQVPRVARLMPPRVICDNCMADVRKNPPNCSHKLQEASYEIMQRHFYGEDIKNTEKEERTIQPPDTGFWAGEK